MFKRFFFFVVTMAAIGLPYLLTSSSDWLGAWGITSPSDGGATKATTGHGKESPTAALSNGAAAPDPMIGARPVEGFGAQDLAEVLQFDGTPSWVMTRWPRVTAGLAELDLQGYRVPLVTGTRDDDLAGSLTYYFDKNQKVARISFHGTTGDPRKLVSLVVSRYNFLQQATDDPSLYLYQAKWNGKAVSELRIRTARVLRANQPHARYEVDLAMKRQ